MNTVTLAELKRLLRYCPVTGEWRRNSVKGGRIIGSLAGGLHKTGYIYIGVVGRYYAAHRLAWFYMLGVWPASHIDHVNGNTSDNKWKNLRLCTPQQNSRNRKLSAVNATGYKGVSFHRETGKYRARIFFGRRKSKSLGLYDSAYEAHLAYVKASKELFGEFSRVC